MSVGGGRVNGGGFHKGLESQERDAEAARLRGRGWSYQKIADQLGYGNRSNAHRAVQQVMAATIAEPAEEARQFQINRINDVISVAFDILERNNYVVSDGRIVRDEHGEAVVDPEMVLKAIDRILKAEDQLSKLLGTHAPKETVVTNVDWLSAEVARLERDLATGVQQSR